MYPLFESIKIVAGEAQHLEWHQKRLDEAYFIYFKSRNIFRLSELIVVPDMFTKDLVKCRFRYSHKTFFIEYEKYLPRIIKTLKIVRDDAINYSLKYWDRSVLEKLLSFKEKCDDILIVKNGYITDTSYSNIVFFNGEKWFTPKNPLLKGTNRERLLEEGIIFDTDICIHDLESFKSFKLINAMIDFEGQSELPLRNIVF